MAGEATQPAAEPPMALDPRTAGIAIFVAALVFGSVHNGLSSR